MAKERTPDRWSTLADPPSHVEITITALRPDRRPPLGERSARVAARARALTALALVVCVVGLAALATDVLHTGRRRAAREASAAYRQAAGPAAIAAAFGYPQRCLAITISATNPDYANAHLEREHGCGNYHGYVNASLHRVDGVWRLVLDEGQLFVPNNLLIPCDADRSGCQAGGGRRS